MRIIRCFRALYTFPQLWMNADDESRRALEIFAAFWKANYRLILCEELTTVPYLIGCGDDACVPSDAVLLYSRVYTRDSGTYS
jgi:hypothetical protein